MKIQARFSLSFEQIFNYSSRAEKKKTAVAPDLHSRLIRPPLTQLKSFTFGKKLPRRVNFCWLREVFIMPATNILK